MTRRKILMILPILAAISAATVLNAKIAVLSLRKPPKSLKADLVRVLVARKMVRTYAGKTVPIPTLSVLLWCADGITKPREGKPLYGLDAGSGATVNSDRKTVAFPFESDCLDLYVLLDKAAYRYDAVRHSLVSVTNGDFRSRAVSGGAPVVLLIAADLERFPFTVARKDRLDFAQTASGAMIQNIGLASAALGLGYFAYSGFNQTELINILGLSSRQAALYLLTVGYPQK